MLVGGVIMAFYCITKQKSKVCKRPSQLDIARCKGGVSQSRIHLQEHRQEMPIIPDMGWSRIGSYFFRGMECQTGHDSQSQ